MKATWIVVAESARARIFSTPGAGKRFEEIAEERRVELEANHRAFIAMGFVETERTAHAGYDRPTSITFRRAVPEPGDGATTD